ncbi:ABC transporter permease [Candidatus Woesearchaeota archaeon]|nr:ABC transporter permease [Candidatus Woesearchaeota archaeon]
MKWYRIQALLLKYWYICIHRADRLFDVFYWPLLDVLLWGFASAFITDLSSYNPLSMLLGGVILWVFIWRASQDISVFVLEDFWSRNLYHVFSSPIRMSEHLTSIILVGFLRSLVTFLFLVIISFFIYSFNFFSIPLLFSAIAIALLSLMGWIMGMFIIGFIFRYGQRIQVLAWSVTWIIQPFSCVFYPLSALPSWAVPIAKALPTTYVFEGLRSVLLGNAINYADLGYAFGIELVLLFLVSLFLKSSFRAAKVSGLLAKGD